MRLRPRRRSSAAILAPCFTKSVPALLALASIASPALALNFTAAASSNIDLSNLGSVGIAGDFSGVSLYQYKEQTQNTVSTNGSEGLMTRLPNGALATVLKTDASIMSMCNFIQKDGTDSGVVLGGNFTSIGTQQVTAIAMFNPNSSQVTAMSGLSGQVNAVLCDKEHNSVFVGGKFIGPNSNNAIAWVDNAWKALSFAGFNGPVTSITKTSNGHIVFGGSFTGLGNASTPTTLDEQVINLSTANISSTGSSTTTGFSDPKNIVCKTSGVDGSGNTWLLQDNTAGSWDATFGFGFKPTKLRLWNTHQDGRGTQTFRFTALPINGIMNFTYTDPATGTNATCTSECPLSNNASVTYQDFYFINEVGMNSFRIDISAWYGSGGGLNGIELFENDIFAYAINSFNEPSCSGSATKISTATTTGAWTESPSFESNSRYLTAQLQSPITSSSVSVTMSPDISQSGNYTVNIYTPGCIQDDSCSTRGQVNITVSMVEGQPSTSIQLFQTNNYDKYDQIYSGVVDAASTSFRPSVTLTPLNNQSLETMTIVAQRVGFTLINSTGGLKGLFEYDPTSSTVNTSDFSTSAFDTLGSSFSTNASVTALTTSGDVTYIAGNFTATSGSNIVSVNSASSTVEALGDSLNGGISALVLNGTNLFVGGTFTSTKTGSVANLTNVAVYNTDKKTWSALGAGVDGPVVEVVAMTMNITGKTPDVVFAFTGVFRHLLAFGSNAAVDVDGFAIWVPSQSNWLQNLVNFTVESVDGVLLSSLLDVPGVGSLYGGSLSYAQVGASGAATLTDKGVGSFGVKILPSSTTTAASSTSTASVSKRDTIVGSNVSGVITGLFDTSSDRNKTVLAGHFSARSESGSLIQNLLIIDNKNNAAVTGLGSGISDSSTFVALAVTGSTLFAGGNVTGSVNSVTVNGLISYNLASNSFNTQPPALTGGNSTVTSIRIRPSSSDVYVGGTFTSAGSLGCPGVCFFSTSASQWNRPGTNLGESTVNAMTWTSSSTLVAGGNLTINTTYTTYLAKYDTSKQEWESFSGASGAIPGPVNALALGSSDGSQLWVAGTSRANASLYLMKYDGSTWTDALGASGQTLSSGTNIRSLQVFSVSTNHDSTGVLSAGQVLMLTGSIVLPEYGTVSAAVFDGKTIQPYALTSHTNNTSGSIASIFVEKDDFFTSGKRHHLPLVAIVLISLGIALVLMLMIVAAGLLLDRLRKKRQGYVKAPAAGNHGAEMSRIPPTELLESLGRRQPDAPRV